MSKESDAADATIADLRSDFGLLSDAAKAEVMKTQITEVEKTRRSKIEQDAQTRRNLHDTDGYHFVRGMFVAFLLALVAGGTCVGYRKMDLEEARVRASLPRADAPAPAHPDAGAQ